MSSTFADKLVDYLSTLEVSKIIEKFNNLYIHIYGELKAEKIYETVRDSELVNHNISTSVIKNQIIPFKIVNTTILSIPYFTFSKGETAAFASIWMVTIWYMEFRENYEDKRTLENLVQFLLMQIVQNEIFWFSSKFKKNCHLIINL